VARAKDSLTLDLFEVPQPAATLPGGMDYRAVVAGLIAEVLRASGVDRHEIAARCSRLTGKDITKYMLDAYTSEAREEFNPPLWLVPAIESACGTHYITNWLVATRGGRLLIGREALTADLGKLERQRIEIEQLIKKLKKQMGEP
jgi:SpoVK/Ycf46/Vps4 family AAA+-type ATPase